MTDIRPVKRALISVSDKAGIVDFARRLAAAGVELVSTGGTARALREASLSVADVSDLTKFPEMMDGRVKTLHPSVHGGLLALRDNPDHQNAMREHAIAPIDLLVVNLYPFEETLASGAGDAACIENIDIGGPAMIRAAAKNHDGVCVVTDPADYEIIDDIEANGGVSLETRRRLAGKAYARTAAYDTAIAAYFAQTEGEALPHRLSIGGVRGELLRYGENPHQEAAFYASGVSRPGAATARQIQGKALSYNNINDTDAAFELIGDLGDEKPAVAIIKHANPCGVARGETLIDAYRAALRCDPVSAFGGIIALNGAIDAVVAREIVDIFTEVIIAPDADEDALSIFAKKKNLRILLTGALPDPTSSGVQMRPVAGGFLAQTRDNGRLERDALRFVSKRAPSEREIEDMLFAFCVAKHVKSNAIVYAKNGATVGVGAGQMSRLDSSRIAAQKAQEAAEKSGEAESLAVGSVVASDAFFPFADGLLAAAAAGATAIVQPGGSMRDDEVIAAADEAGLAMAFTGMRHFRH